MHWGQESNRSQLRALRGGLHTTAQRSIAVAVPGCRSSAVSSLTTSHRSYNRRSRTRIAAERAADAAAGLCHLARSKQAFMRSHSCRAGRQVRFLISRRQSINLVNTGLVSCWASGQGHYIPQRSKTLSTCRKLRKLANSPVASSVQLTASEGRLVCSFSVCRL